MFKFNVCLSCSFLCTWCTMVFTTHHGNLQVQTLTGEETCTQMTLERILSYTTKTPQQKRLTGFNVLQIHSAVQDAVSLKEIFISHSQTFLKPLLLQTNHKSKVRKKPTFAICLAVTAHLMLRDSSQMTNSWLRSTRALWYISIVETKVLVWQ
jgi:hypothetical protein